jgi:signal transduction histidine kinase
MAYDTPAEIAAIARIPAVPTILDVVCRTTGMGFAAVARVTDASWTACTVLDGIDFGLKAGDELAADTTICAEIRTHRQAVVIDHVAEDATYRGHEAPARYGFQSYISVPITLSDGAFFGTLCAIDPQPRPLNTPATIGMFTLFAELIAFHIDAQAQLADSNARLFDEIETARLREQFIAVLGHDLRNPLAAIDAGARLLERRVDDPKSLKLVGHIQSSVVRMARLISDVLDFARGRLGDGLNLARDDDTKLEETLRQVIAESQATHPASAILADIRMEQPMACDAGRIGQMLSNLIGNAVTHGASDKPIRVRAVSHEGRFELSVANSGPAIPPEAMANLFQPFFRGSVRSSDGGLGLGLYISSEIARAHGGTLGVESDAGETVFTFRMAG